MSPPAALSLAPLHPSRQWWPHAASTLAVAAGSSVLVADIRAPAPSGSRLLSLPRYSTRAGGAGALPPAVTCLAFEAAPCAHPWCAGGAPTSAVAI